MAAKVFGLKTRDMIVEACADVKNMKENYGKQDEKLNQLYGLIRECHDDCPETQRFNEYSEAQNGTLLRMERKYDKFYKEHSEVKTAVEGLTASKKSIKGFLKDIALIIATFGVICGIVLGIMKYNNTKKSGELVQAETVLKRLLEEHKDSDW